MDAIPLEGHDFDYDYEGNRDAKLLIAFLPKLKNFDKKWELIETEDQGWKKIQHTESGRFLRFCGVKKHGNKEIQYFKHILCFS